MLYEVNCKKNGTIIFDFETNYLAEIADRYECLIKRPIHPSEYDRLIKENRVVIEVGTYVFELNLPPLIEVEDSCEHHPIGQFLSRLSPSNQRFS